MTFLTGLRLCVYVCLLFCGPTDSSCKCRPLMMSQLPSESTCQGGRQRIWTCCFLTGKGVSAVDQFKYVDGEGLLSTSLPHCCASVHEAGSFFQLSYVSFDMYNFLVRGKKKNLVTVPYRWRRMRSWEELTINAVNACVWFRPTTRQSETSWKRWRNQMACEYTVTDSLHIQHIRTTWQNKYCTPTQCTRLDL